MQGTYLRYRELRDTLSPHYVWGSEGKYISSSWIGAFDLWTILVQNPIYVTYAQLRQLLGEFLIPTFKLLEVLTSFHENLISKYQQITGAKPKSLMLCFGPKVPSPRTWLAFTVAQQTKIGNTRQTKYLYWNARSLRNNNRIKSIRNMLCDRVPAPVESLLYFHTNPKIYLGFEKLELITISRGVVSNYCFICTCIKLKNPTSPQSRICMHKVTYLL